MAKKAKMTASVFSDWKALVETKIEELHEHQENIQNQVDEIDEVISDIEDAVIDLEDAMDRADELL